jgi:hypothetical protein
MSLLDAPFAVLDRIRGRARERVRTDDPVARMVARTTVRLRPTGRYQRWLRGHVVNQYVAAREGVAPAAPRRPGRQMGLIGRAVLVSSLALAVSVTAVGAASQGALPGDALYPVKRQLEAIRMEIAPAWIKPTLVAMALDERLSEVEQLAREGAWARAAAAASDVDAAEAALTAIAGAIPEQQQEAIAHHSAVLSVLLANAPEAAKAGLEQALAASNKANAAATSRAGGHGPAGAPGQADKQGASASPNAVPTPRPTPPGQPTSPRVNPSPGS